MIIDLGLCTNRELECMHISVVEKFFFVDAIGICAVEAKSVPLRSEDASLSHTIPVLSFMHTSFICTHAIASPLICPK